MKKTKILKSFNDLSEAPDAWVPQPERPEASPIRFWNEATALREDTNQPEELAADRPVRRWGINE
jgi:hypothetical protein